MSPCLDSVKKYLDRDAWARIRVSWGLVLGCLRALEGVESQSAG